MFRSNDLKTPDQIQRMREAGLLVWEAHQIAARLVRPGVPTREIDAAVESFLLKRKAIPVFKGVPGKVPYPASTCLSVNSEVVHGIPSDRVLKDGDIISIDIGVKLNGWCGDAAVTHPVGQISAQARELLEVTEGALRQAIQGIATASRWNQVAARMQRFVEERGFSVVRTLVGHAIGQEMWERPQVPNYYDRRANFELLPGLVLAVEPMVNVGKPEVKVEADHWTVSTVDGSWSAHFEHTIAVTPEGPRVLTASPDGSGWALGADPSLEALPLEPALPTGGKIGRNDPCPCGSGLKFKKCCGRRESAG